MKDEIVIRPLAATEAIKFLIEQAKIEREYPFMPTSGGQRHEQLVMALLRMFIHRKRVLNLVAWRGAEIAGYTTLIFGRYSKFRGNAYIANVSVKKEMQGKGIGTMLMNAAESQARERRARRLELEVFAKNITALSLYEKLGYQTEGRKRKAIEDEHGFDDLIFMAKFL